MEYLEIIIPSLMDKMREHAISHKALSQLLERIQQNQKNKSKELLTEIYRLEDTIDSIIARKMLQRQNISIENVPIKLFTIASVKFPYELHKQTKELKILNDYLSASATEEKLSSKSDAVELPAKESSSTTVPQKKSSGNTVPQKKSSKDAAVAVLSKKPSISGGIQVSPGHKDVGRDNKDSDERNHESWEEGCVPIVLEELISKLAEQVLLSRRMRQLLILKANLERPSDAIFLWTSYHSSVTKQHFQFCCWVLVSKESEERNKEFEERNILSYILKQGKQEASEQSNQLLRKRLHDFLVFKRYLIVLYGELGDDVWDSLKSAFPYSLNGSRVLLISKGITSANVSKEWSSQQLGKSKEYLLEESRIVGMKDIMTELYQSILNQHKLLFLISIVGVAESEKTTFLWAMYNAGDIKQQFQSCAWVRVQKFEEKKLLADILAQVTDNKVEEEDLDLLQKKLCNFLAPKRYLIVLYDVWTADVWDKLKQAFPNSMNGSRVILAIHEADVAWQTNSSWILGTVCGKELPHEKVSNLKVKHRWGRFSDVKPNESGLVGLDDKVLELAELLLESYQFLISVLGVPGSGKTMLVKTIYSSLAIKQHFECRGFVSVSRVYEERKLLADLSMQLGMVRKDESWSKEEWLKRLRSFLAWKRYLIVLDDVYTADDYNVWERLGPAFPNSSNGSRVILTTRDAWVPRNIKAYTRVIQLRYLNDDESWALFAKKVPKVKDNAELMKALKEEILQNCGGLPLDVVLLGGLLSTKELNIPVWSKFIEQVSQKKEKKRKVTGEDGMKPENGKKSATEQSYSFTQRDSSDTKLEEKDGQGEIEEIGPSEAAPMEEEEKLKHGASKEDQEPSLNQLPSSSDTKQKEDNGILENQNTSLDQDQSDASDLSGILALGYQDLETHSKFCLNYLGLFPKLYKVPFRRLFQLLQAEGLLKPEAKELSFEEQVKKYIEDLKKRNMIVVEEQRLNGRPKTICMESSVYDTLCPRALRAGLFHSHFNNDKKDAPKEYMRRLAEHQEISYDKLPEQSRQLRSYISFKTQNDDLPAFGVDKLLKEIVKGGLGLIVILDLEGVYKPVLSKHLGKLPNLKYLGLRWTFLDSIPNSVGDLPSLETLDLKHTNISTLPGEFWKAKCLQHLYMNNICVDTSIPKARQTNGSLTKLETLLGLVIRNKNSVDYLVAANMNGLRKLGVTCSEKLVEEIVRWISRLTKLQSLKLRSINENRELSSLQLGDLSHLDHLSQLYLCGKLAERLDVKNFPSDLESLTLAVSELSNDPMEELGKLKRLKILRLHAHSYMGKTMKCGRGTFPELQVLKLWMLKELKKWEVEDGAMPALKEVEIRCCKKLSDTDGLKKLATLRELILTSMKQDFVKELKESLGSNVEVIENKDWKFSSTWEEKAQGDESMVSMESTA